MVITSKKICTMDSIVLLATLYWVKNFKPCNKHMYVLAKKVSLVTRNISVKILELQLEKIWKNRELAKLEKLVSKIEDWLTEILQWAIQTRGVEQ